MYNHFKLSFYSCLGILLLTGCPSDEYPGFELDTPIFIKNTTDTLSNFTAVIAWREELSDSLISNEEIGKIRMFTNSLFCFEIESQDSVNFMSISSEGSVNFPQGKYVFIISCDTLDNYTEETWDREAGVKRYFFYDWEDYEEINFTMEYP